jgi:hypothetical protein
MTDTNLQPFHQALAPGKTVGDGIKEMERIAKDVLDESFTLHCQGSPERFCRKFF